MSAQQKGIDMENLEYLSHLIKDYYSKSKIEKTIAILSALRSGEFYYNSNERKFLIGNYKCLISSLSEEEYLLIKNEIISCVPNLIKDRDNRNIAYSLLSDIITNSCWQNDFDVFAAYQKEIFRLATINRDKYLYHIITLAQTANRLNNSISDIQDFFIDKYLQLSRLNTINYGGLIDFATNVENSNKRKLLMHIMGYAPFRNDFIIRSFIFRFDELQKFAILL